MGWVESDIRLIERNRDYLMASQVAHVAHFNRQIVARLPLQVQRVVDRVRQLVGAVIDAQRDRLAIVDNAGRP